MLMALQRSVVATTVVFAFLAVLVSCGPDDPQDPYKPRRREKPPDSGDWKKKDVRDFNDIDLDHLYEQWEEDEEELPVDELSPWEVDPPAIDMSKVNLKDPDSVLREGKRKRNLMMFASVVGKPNEKETEKITSIWQSSLYNANIEITRYVIEPGKILINMNDGANGVQIRDYLVTLQDCWDVTIDSKTYDGLGKKLAENIKPKSKEEVREENLKAKAEKEAKKKARQEKEAEKKAKEAKKKEKQKEKKEKKKAQEKTEL